MALEGELEGLNGTACVDCDASLVLTVCRSSAGFYLGSWCTCCGPYSRETGYFATRKEAKAALDAYLEEGEKPENIRTTEWRR